MNPEIVKIRQKVLKKIVPGEVERERVRSLSEDIMKKVSFTARKASLKAEVSLEGSVAKDTWISNEADIDIFLRVESSLDRSELETTCLHVAKEAIKGHKPIERFADHPYIETFIDNSRVNIVPCYNVDIGKWKSATDRTHYHTEYMNKHLDTNLRNEVRLLKRLMKANGTYGSEIRIGGFSGMLCETLILNYQSLEKTLRAASKWKEGTTMDLENYFGGDYQEIHDLFDQPLIVIDPVDKTRNLAASVRHERLWEFVSLARSFLFRPSLKFFYPLDLKGINRNGLKNALCPRETSLIGLIIGKIDAPVDVIWSQIFKTEKSVVNLLRARGFSVIRSASFSDEQSLNIIIIEIEKRALSKTIKRQGPPVEKMKESNSFLSAHLHSRDTVSGPWIENNKWVTLKVRKHPDAIELLKDSLLNGGRNVGVSSLISEVIKRGQYKLLVDLQLCNLLDSEGFSKFMNNYLNGKPAWLR